MPLKASLRLGSDKDIRRARRALRSLNTQSCEDMDALNEAVTYIYKVFFRVEGPQGLASAMRVVAKRTKIPRTELFKPTYQALTYSKNFKGLKAFLEEMEVANANKTQLFLPHVNAHLIQGDVGAAKETAWTYLRRSPPGQVRRQLVTLLLQMGEINGLLREYPDLCADYPFVQRAEYLSPSDENEVVPLFCINLDRDEERLERARFFQSGGTDFHRSPGVSGHSLPRTILAATGLNITVPRIAQVGCHMAHMKAWEAVVDKVPEGTHGLVTEDDAVFMYGPGRGLSQALRLASDHGVDLLFINFEPMAYRPFLADEKPQLLSVGETLSEIYPNRVNGWGGESYLLTPRGARKLIEMSSEIGMVGPLDWQIALYGAEHLDIDRLEKIGPVGSIIEPLKNARRAHGRSFFVRAGVVTVPLMRQLDLGYTAHNLEVSLAAA